MLSQDIDSVSSFLFLYFVTDFEDGLLITMLSTVSIATVTSCDFADVITVDSGIPSLSVKICLLEHVCVWIPRRAGQDRARRGAGASAAGRVHHRPVPPEPGSRVRRDRRGERRSQRHWRGLVITWRYLVAQRFVLTQRISADGNASRNVNRDGVELHRGCAAATSCIARTGRTRIRHNLIFEGGGDIRQSRESRSRPGISFSSFLSFRLREHYSASAARRVVVRARRASPKGGPPSRQGPSRFNRR